jgi:DUF971 family protein
MKHALPTRLEKTDHGSLLIHWSDGRIHEYPIGKLREACPCATCKERKKEKAETGASKALRVLKPEETVGIDIRAMRPVGNYAYNITFSDGHSSGLFTMELLWELGNTDSEHRIKTQP